MLGATSISKAMNGRRELVRTIYRDSYEERIGPVREIIKGYARRHKLSNLAAALAICKQAVKDGHGSAVNSVIAAVVDLSEGA